MAGVTDQGAVAVELVVTGHDTGPVLDLPGMAAGCVATGPGRKIGGRVEGHCVGNIHSMAIHAVSGDKVRQQMMECIGRICDGIVAGKAISTGRNRQEICLGGIAVGPGPPGSINVGDMA
jgi:hypothetical protein